MEKLVGRETEIGILKEALTSDNAEMIAVVGRRRIGKTFLIEETYKNELVFSVTGVQNSPYQEQLGNFIYHLNEYIGSEIPFKTPANWMEAFQFLITYLKTKVSPEEKKVVFLDELPWLATRKSGFLRGLSFFWNSWAVKQNIVVVICGSAASWMIQKVVYHRGGLHNRITRQIFLEAFTLAETEQYLQSRNLHFDRYHIVQLYMAMGGVPHYLQQIKKGKSATQSINEICFSKQGILSNEFSKLYPALFTNADFHIALIRTLAKKRGGMTRQEIVANGEIKEGGQLKKVLEELEQSAFITSYLPFGKLKKNKLYRLTDEYSLFYLKFIEKNQYVAADTWNHLSQTQEYKTWSGYAFENICLKNFPSIKNALGISGIYAIPSSFYKRGTATEKGAQIDLVLDRKDHTINLFEVKFSNETYAISKTVFENLSNKISTFRTTTQTKKQLTLIFITTFGLVENQYSSAIVQQSLTLDDLFDA